MAITSYEDALAFWFGRINYEQRGMPSDPRVLRLERMKLLLERLDQPQARLKIIHVAGSKGKGSTSAIFAAVLKAAGIRQGLFTSPHLSRPEERIQIDGRPISRHELVSLMRRIEPACCFVAEREGFEPTFFEIATALGLLHFAERGVEWAVMEVGLGGRFDATNVCLPELAVITSISFDHQEQLGYTLASIAAEKAGIVKPSRPAVRGPMPPEAADVIDRIACERSAPLLRADHEFHFLHRPGRVNGRTIEPGAVCVTTTGRKWPWMPVNLLGPHQAANAAVAVAGLELLAASGLAIDDVAVRRGLAQVRWPARMELLRRRPFVVLDCAHNHASIQAMLDTLHASFPPCRRTLIFGGSRDKDLAGMLAMLTPHFERAVLTRYLGSPRSASGAELYRLWHQAGGGEALAVERPVDAWRQALASTPTDGLICITGSVFLAGELRSLIRAEL